MKNKLKVWHFSDSHTNHGLLQIPDNIDIAIFSGDCSNPRDKYQNEQKVLNFLCWYGLSVKATYKIFVAGNHDTSVEARLIKKEKFEEYGIIYLENESIELKFTVDPIKQETRSIKIWGSPVTPSFGVGWAFNKSREKLHDLWSTIPEDTDIVISHGPPKGILDLSYNRNNVLEFCGCSALKKRMLKIQPKLVCYGHIHNTEDIINAGYTKLSDYNTIYSNGSVVTDGKFGKLSSNGNIFEL